MCVRFLLERYLMFGYELAAVALAGSLSGYVVYDMIHYHCHFR